jgi:very-short-patch-repair endonuclease
MKNEKPLAETLPPPSCSLPTLPTSTNLFGGTSLPHRANNQLRRQAQQEREHPTPAEQNLWHHLYGRQLQGLKFRRQHIALGYILDFYCPEYRIALELDGPNHLPERDLYRDQMLMKWDVLVLRFPNSKPTEEILAAVSAAVRGRQLAFIEKAARATSDLKAIGRSADWYASRRAELQRQKLALARRNSDQLELSMPSSVRKLAQTEESSLPLRGMTVTEKKA